MNRVLRKRIFRQLKANFARYLALMLLIAFGMYIVTSLVAGAQTIMTGTSEYAQKNHVEDGQFSVFLPLTGEQESEIAELGVTMEEIFSFDLSMEDSSKLRIMKVREFIDLIELDEGTLPTESGQCVVEKRYAAEHDLSTGDELSVAGTTLTITGIGSVPDYDAPYESFSDMAVSSNAFGLLFVTEEQYEQTKKDAALTAEDYTYAYLLGEEAAFSELKSLLQSFSFEDIDLTDSDYLKLLCDALGLEFNSVEAVLSSGAVSGIDMDLGSDADLDSDVASGSGVDLGSDVGLGSNAESGSDVASVSDAEVQEMIAAVQMLLEMDNLTSFVERDDNIRIAAAAGDVVINKLAGLAAGVIVMILFTYVISVFVVHQIQKESSVIGTLYALGAKRRDLILHYITLPVLMTFVGGVLGALLGMGPLGQDVMIAETYEYFSIPYCARVYPVYLIVYSILMPPLTAALVNALVIRRKLSGTVLSLMRKEASARPVRRRAGSHCSGISSFHTVSGENAFSASENASCKKKVSTSGASSRKGQLRTNARQFVYHFQFRQIRRELRTSVTVIFGMLLALLILMIGLDCNVLCINIGTETVRDTLYEYMYVLKWPSSEIPAEGEACYVQSLSKEQYGYTIDVSVMGMEDGNPYFPNINTHEGTNQITASTAAAQKFGLKVGDEFVLTDAASETEYTFTVAEIGEYAAGLMVFMDIGSMRELFDETEDYYNCLLSDEELDIEENQLYSVTTKENITYASGIFVELMEGMIAMMTVVAVIVFCVVMYLMQGVMIDRAAFGISLLKVFGYRTKEVRKLYLDGNIYTVIIGALVGIPLSKAIMDAMYPFLIANIASGMNLTFPWYYYPVIFAGILLIYAVVNLLLVRKLGKITHAEVLKNRE